MTTYDEQHFAQMFSVDDDPWGFKSRWYEKRKRALTAACLQKDSYQLGFEPGCANGELSATLATRCDRLIVSDGADAAVTLAKSRLAEFSHAEVRKYWVPNEWPEEKFDLIVLSEFLFYLSPEDIRAIARRTLESLVPGGTVVACHWRNPVPDSVVSGDESHDMLESLLNLRNVCSVREPQTRIDVWSNAPTVAEREGIVET